MPRFENTGLTMSEWSTATGEGSTTHDICADCAIDFERDPLAAEGDKLEHPNYDWDVYICARCGRDLDEDVDG